MSATLSVVAAALVRAWAWIYTSGTPGFVREGRRQEIESDLWEQQRNLAGEPDVRARRTSSFGCSPVSPTICCGASSIAAR